MTLPEGVTTEMLLEAVKLAGVELPTTPVEPMREYQSILTHNGLFTVRSIATGEHRTFRVRSQPVEAKFAPGKRVVSVLTGPDNTADYTQFGFVTDQGIQVWERKRGGKFEEYARMLEKLPQHLADGKVEVHVSCRCRVCNRTLTTPESVRSGIGPVCEGRR